MRLSAETLAGDGTPVTGAQVEWWTGGPLKPGLCQCLHETGVCGVAPRLAGHPWTGWAGASRMREQARAGQYFAREQALAGVSRREQDGASTSANRETWPRDLWGREMPTS